MLWFCSVKNSHLVRISISHVFTRDLEHSYKHSCKSFLEITNPTPDAKVSIYTDLLIILVNIFWMGPILLIISKWFLASIFWFTVEANYCSGWIKAWNLMLDISNTLVKEDDSLSNKLMEVEIKNLWISEDTTSISAWVTSKVLRTCYSFISLSEILLILPSCLCWAALLDSMVSTYWIIFQFDLSKY